MSRSASCGRPSVVFFAVLSWLRPARFGGPVFFTNVLPYLGLGSKIPFGRSPRLSEHARILCGDFPFNLPVRPHVGAFAQVQPIAVRDAAAAQIGLGANPDGIDEKRLSVPMTNRMAGQAWFEFGGCGRPVKKDDPHLIQTLGVANSRI